MIAIFWGGPKYFLAFSYQAESRFQHWVAEYWGNHFSSLPDWTFKLLDQKIITAVLSLSLQIFVTGIPLKVTDCFCQFASMVKLLSGKQQSRKIGLAIFSQKLQVSLWTLESLSNLWVDSGSQKYSFLCNNLNSYDDTPTLVSGYKNYCSVFLSLRNKVLRCQGVMQTSHALADAPMK